LIKYSSQNPNTTITVKYFKNVHLHHWLNLVITETGRLNVFLLQNN
jgi:hypothetical protein